MLVYIGKMELIHYTNKLLTEVCQEFDFEAAPLDPVEFSKDLVKTMRDLGGIGLAANQVGYPYRVFAMRSDPNKVMFNPKLVHSSAELISLEEGCLSFPGLYVTVTRPRHVRVRYTQPNGETITELFTGMSARVVQHEMDHLDGILFYNRANRYHRELALKKWRKNNG